MSNYWTRKAYGRRAVLRGGGLGIAGLTGAALIGCGSDDEPVIGATPPPSGTQGGSSPTSTPAPGNSDGGMRGGTLNLRETPQTQDFHRHTGTMSTPSMVCDCPTAVDAEGQTQNFLLESIEAPDASNYTLTFRPGIKFHNSREMTSDDVRLNIERIQATDGAWLQGALGGVTEIETPDDQTVVLALDQPYSPLITLMSELWLMAPESPGWEGTIETPIGTGPFVWKEWIPNDRIHLDAFEEYWQEGRPYVDAIQVRNLSGDTTPALLAGDLHISGVGNDQRALVGNNPDVTLMLEKATSWDFLSFNNRQPSAPYDDIRVRQAIGHALDKAAIADFTAGDAAMVADQMAPPGSFYWSDQIVDPFATQDLEAGRQLLDAAGFGPGDLTPVMPVNTNPANPEVISAQLAQIGVMPQLEVADDVTTETRLQAYNWDLYYAGSGPRSDIALRYVRMMSDGPNPGLWGGPQDPEYDRLVLEAWSIVDAEERKQKYLEAWQVVMDKLFTIVTLHRSNTTGVRREVQGWDTGAVANFNRIDGGVAHITLQS